MSVVGHIKKLAGESLVYGLSGIITRFIGVFLFPLFTRVFTPNDYGVISILNSIYFVVNVIAILGLNSAAFRWYYNTDDVASQKNAIATWFWFELFSSAFICFLFIIFNDRLELLFFDKVSGLNYFYYLGFSLLLNVIPSVAISFYRLRRMPFYSVMYSLIVSLSNVALNIFLILFRHWGIEGFLMSQAIAGLIGTLAGFISFRDWLRPVDFVFSTLKDMLRYGVALLPAGLSTTFVLFVSNNVILHFTNTAQVGFYQVGATIASGILLLTSAFAQAWTPFSLSIMNQSNAIDVYRHTFRIYIASFTVLCLSVAVFAPEIIKIFATEVYYPSAVVAGVLSFGNLISGLNVIAFTGLSIKKSTGGYAKITLISACFTAILLFALVPVWGKIGAALALLTGQSIIPVFLFYQSHKVYPIAFPFKGAVITLASALVLFLLLVISQDFFGNDLLYVKPFIILLFGVIIYFLNRSTVTKLFEMIKVDLSK